MHLKAKVKMMMEAVYHGRRLPLVVVVKTSIPQVVACCIK